MAAEAPANLGFSHLWLDRDDGRSLSALLNGDLGFLTCFRLTSRNPDSQGPADATVEYRLQSGHHAWHPAAGLPAATCLKAVEQFERTGEPAPFVTWHNDS
jgi:hypothetical protein